MDRNTVIGFTLIFLIFIAWQQFMAPSAEQQAEQQRLQDSIQLAQRTADSLAQLEADAPSIAAEENTATSAISTIANDSIRNSKIASEFGPFAPAAVGEDTESIVENDLMKVTFSSKGGRITQVELKNHFKVLEDEEGNQTKVPLYLLEDDKNKFDYFLPIATLPSGGVRTSELYFTAQATAANTMTFRADAGEGRYFEQSYTIEDSTYVIDYDIKLEGLNNVIAKNVETIQLQWVNWLDKLEINTQYERNYSSIYYKPADGEYDHCSCTSDDTEDVENKPIKWVSHSNQFFNSTIIAEEAFTKTFLETKTVEEDSPDLKQLRTDLFIPITHSASERFEMQFYVGPNEFERLQEVSEDLEYIIPFGWSIFGTVNRWVIRPLFSFLSMFISSKGIVILVLTVLVKLALYPLTYRMLYSQSKMAALKPEIEAMKSQHKENQQEQQMATMKLYREFGVNPLGGCFPMLLQMPIWFALYRFFPAAIEFRQASFLWATDLSSYDVIARLPFELPLGFGAHLSLFTILWAVTTLIYTFYNTRHMDFSANPAMKYMQYIMPVMFLGFFNSFASGLTCYLLFSNTFNIGQTLITKNYIIDQDKIKQELQANKNKPKKKSGFQKRLQDALEEQRKIQAQRDAQKKKKKKK
ncbi:MAG: membrane protein insertase YidC [Bacteroidota bacterium]